MPQSMMMDALPVAWMPVLLLFCRLSTQNSPELPTVAAWAMVRMTGALAMNIELNASGRLTARSTRTWFFWCCRHSAG